MGVEANRRKTVFERDGYKCVYCRRNVVDDATISVKMRATVDHLRLKSRGGSDSLENLVTACYKCNHSRADRNWRDFANTEARNYIERIVLKFNQAKISFEDAARKRLEKRLLEIRQAHQFRMKQIRSGNV